MSSPDMGGEVRLVHGSIRNPLADRTNVASHSGGCHISYDLDRNVILIDKENAVIPNSVSPSPFWHPSRFFPSKV